MKAIVIREFGGPEVLNVADVAAPVAGESHIRVRVRATALNRADVLQRMGRYPPPPGVPENIPGLEFAGEVESCGAGVTLWKVGDRVMGLLAGAGYAEYVTIHERMALAIPRRMDFVHAAAIPEAFLASFDALFLQLKIAAGETVMIHAASSGVGTAALQLASHAGARVIAVSRAREKLEALRGLGAFQPAVLGDAFVADVRHIAPGGVSAIFDLVGASVWESNIELLAPGGRLLVFGFLGGAKAELDLGTVLRKRLHIMGTALRSRPIEEKIALSQCFAARALPLFAEGRLRPVIDRVFDFHEVVDAHRAMESNAGIGKIVLRGPA